MKLKQSIELTHRSTGRLMQAIAPNVAKGDRNWMIFMRRECWHLLKLAIRLYWRLRFHRYNTIQKDF